VRYLTASEVMLVNEQEVGPELLADFGLLEAAVLRPQQSVFGSDAYPDMHTKAAAMMHSLIRNHAFIDGNKRTGVLATILFYNLNGYTIETAQEDLIALALDIAEGQIDVEGIAGILKSWVQPHRLPEG
jgi:death on curing protein